MAGDIPYDEKELLIQISEGDERAFEQLYIHYLPKLRPYLVEMTKSVDRADDVIQEAFIRIWLSRTKFVEVENPNAWIFRVAANECYKMLRRMATEKRHFNSLTAGGEYYVEHDIQYKQTRRFVEEAVLLLSPRRRKIYEMSRLEGMKPAQIAEELNLSVSTVKNTLVTILEIIREYLAGQGIILSASLIVYFF